MRKHLLTLLVAILMTPACVFGQSGSMRGVWTVQLLEQGTDSQFCKQAPPSSFPLTIEVRQPKPIGIVLVFTSAPPRLATVKATDSGFELYGREPWPDFTAEWNSGATTVRLRIDRPSSTDASFQSFGLTYEELEDGRVACRARYSGGPFTRISKMLPLSKTCKKSCARKCSKKPKKKQALCKRTCGDGCMSK